MIFVFPYFIQQLHIPYRKKTKTLFQTNKSINKLRMFVFLLLIVVIIFTSVWVNNIVLFLYNTKPLRGKKEKLFRFYYIATYFTANITTQNNGQMLNPVRMYSLIL